MAYHSINGTAVLAFHILSLTLIMTCMIANIVDPGEIQQKGASYLNHAVGKLHF